jgi:hypothetical protein
MNNIRVGALDARMLASRVPKRARRPYERFISAISVSTFSPPTNSMTYFCSASASKNRDTRGPPPGASETSKISAVRGTQRARSTRTLGVGASQLGFHPPHHDRPAEGHLRQRRRSVSARRVAPRPSGAVAFLIGIRDNPRARDHRRYFGNGVFRKRETEWSTDPSQYRSRRMVPAKRLCWR